MCQLAEAKQEPSFVSNTFFKQVRGSWVGTQLEGISLSLSLSLSWKPNPEDIYLCLGKTSSPRYLEMFALAKGRQKPWQSPGAWGSGPAPAACWHPACTATPQPRGRRPQCRGGPSLALYWEPGVDWEPLVSVGNKEPEYF